MAKSGTYFSNIPDSKGDRARTRAGPPELLRRVSLTRKKLRRLYQKASQAAGRRGRLSRADQYRLLTYAYGRLRTWGRKGLMRGIAPILVATLRVPVSRDSGVALLFLRAALPNLDPKRASKWAAALEAADHHRVPKRKLVSYLKTAGGIEGAAGERARIRTNRP